MRILKLIGAILLSFVKILSYQWIVGLVDIFKRFLKALKTLWKRRRLPHDQRHRLTGCLTVNNPSFHRPDPCIYSQEYLIKLGLPVTWDNPDIALFLNGVQIDESQPLFPATKYEIEATIWNNSYDAPVVDMPVDFSFLSFGAATTSTPITTAKTTVGVKGGAHHPAKLRVPWITPGAGGHFCVQVKLIWIDDANPGNNLGQNNLNVAAAHSPAAFSFQLRNPFDKAYRFHLTADTYTLQTLPECGTVSQSTEKRSTRIDRVVARHRAMNFGVPPGWGVEFTPGTPTLGPGAETTINASFTPPAGFTGEQRFNVNAYTDTLFAGGVTLIVQKA